MKLDQKSLLSLLISLSLGSLTVWYVWVHMDVNLLLREFEKANYFWIFASMAVSSIAFIARGLRWNLLTEPAGYPIRAANSVRSVFIGYLANYAFPRVGEVARCSVVLRTDKVPLSIGLGTVITERIVDLLAMMLVFGLSLLFEYERILQTIADFGGVRLSQIHTQIHSRAFIIFPLLGILLMCIVAAWIYRARWISWGPIQKIVSVFGEVWQGMWSIRKLSNPGLFIAYSLLIWLVFYAMTYVIFFSMQSTAHLPASSGLVVLAMASLGMIAPVQGGFGTYHLMVALGLSFYGIEQSQGLILATLLHTSQLVFCLLAGGLSLLTFALFPTLSKTTT